jgi:hypothetical protein
MSARVRLIARAVSPDDHTWAVLLEDEDSGEPLGGLRVQRRSDLVELPIERALARVDARARAWVDSLAPLGVGELCGLWYSPDLRGYGLGARLTCMGIALASAARTRTLLGLCDARSVDENLRLGFRLDLTLASNGRFEHPRPGLVAHVLRLDDAYELPAAPPEIRAAVHDYRSRPRGREVLGAGERQLELHRELESSPREIP